MRLGYPTKMADPTHTQWHRLRLWAAEPPWINRVAFVESSDIWRSFMHVGTPTIIALLAFGIAGCGEQERETASEATHDVAEARIEAQEHVADARTEAQDDAL